MNKLVIKSDVKNISTVENLIDEIVEKNNISSEIYGKALLAVIECVNNAIIHGNKSDISKDVTIKYDITDKELIFNISDQGPGFDFHSLPDPTLPENILKVSGRGIFLMKNLSDKLEFNDLGNEISIFFNL